MHQNIKSQHSTFISFKVKLIETIQQKIDQLTKDIADQENVERDLQDNLDLMKMEKETASLLKQKKELQHYAGETDFSQMTREKNEIKKKIDNIDAQCAIITGQLVEKEKNIKETRATLALTRYKDARQNYRKSFYEHVVLKKIVIDLNTYCETLERALTKYHSEKMAKINRLIRELWRDIYRGNDIDYIQINTEEVKSTAKKRSYTYRVVQSKNDVVVDMRGRCSAGQRVLACLVIRIALAETFSSNCGVLALDEPTTNLDSVNIESLCDALNRIVEEREGQSNFMLLVITHDEKFIDALGK